MLAREAVNREVEARPIYRPSVRVQRGIPKLAGFVLLV